MTERKTRTVYRIQVPGYPEGTWLDHGHAHMTEQEARNDLAHVKKHIWSKLGDTEYRLVKIETTVLEEKRT